MRILITGGTGTLGHALVDHYLKTTDHRLIVLSRDELKQSVMREEFPDARLDFFLGDVRDLRRLELAFDANVDVVIHAAALKRVDSVCHDPDEVLKTNVLGSRNVLHAARGRVKKCLLISSDKACYPTNAYGISKAMAEALFTSFNVYGIPKGSASAVVRYGNVLGSRGSVVTVWKKQMAQGFPLTLTHPEMTRFLITLPQAIQVIETAIAEMEGGEVFVPQLKAALVVDMIQALKRNYVVTGLRPGGEKLHETLMTEEESQRLARAALDIWEEFAIITPEIHPWRGTPMMLAYREPPAAWRSDTAPRIPTEQLREMMKEIVR